MKSHEAKQTTKKDVLAEMDQLIHDLSEPPAVIMQRLEDTYFDEIIEMLRQADIDHSYEPDTVSAIESDNDDFMKEILKEIAVYQHQFEEEETIDTLKKMTKKIDTAKENLESRWKVKEYMKSVALEMTDKRYSDKCLEQRIGIEQQAHHDNLRIVNQFLLIEDLVKQLPLWSPARNHYQKIIKSPNPDIYLKVQRLIQTANTIANQYQKKETGFFSRQLFNKANQIHKRIAKMDINNEPANQVKLGIKA